MTTDNRDEPPPYTPTPSFSAGESTLEHGPPLPFHSPPPAQSSAWPRLQHHVLSTPAPSLIRHLTSSFNNLVNQLDHTARPGYPEQHPPPNQVDPIASSPQPPRPSSSSVRDFYAAGTSSQPAFAPPPGPPPTMQAQYMPSPPPPDGIPTAYPAIGHPLLNDGNVLVYPKGYKCNKCMFTLVSPLLIY
jgi:hypothetical protein